MPKELTFQPDEPVRKMTQPPGRPFKLCGRLESPSTNRFRFFLDSIEGDEPPPVIVTSRFLACDISRGNGHWQLKSQVFGWSVYRNDQQIASIDWMGQTLKMDSRDFILAFEEARPKIVSPEGRTVAVFVKPWKDSERKSSAGVFYIESIEEFGKDWPAILVLAAIRFNIEIYPSTWLTQN